MRVIGHALQATHPRIWGSSWPGMCQCGADPPGDVMTMVWSRAMEWHREHKFAVISEQPELMRTDGHDKRAHVVGGVGTDE